MQLGEKLRVLRGLEGSLRGLNRPLHKAEVVRLLQEELGASVSQAYLSQLESGKRQHMTASTRELLARFFKVHPGYLVSDPEGFRTDIASMEPGEEHLDDWLLDGARTFRAGDPELADALRTIAQHKATRQVLVALARLIQTPEAVASLRERLPQAIEDNSASAQKGGMEE